MRKYLSLLIAFQFATLCTAQEKWSVKLLTPDSGAIQRMAKTEWIFMLPEKAEKLVQEFRKDNHTGLNPFDPADIDLSAVFTSPSGKQKKAVGFYMLSYGVKKNENTWYELNSPFPWRLRFAPDEVGDWVVVFTLRYRGMKYTEKLYREFKCSESGHPGRIAVDEGKKYLKYTHAGAPFFAIGENIAHSAQLGYSPQRAELHKKWLNELADAHGNFFRLEIGAQSFLPDWTNHLDYCPRMGAMSALDDIVSLCEKRSLYFIAFRHHVELQDGAGWMEQRWGLNSYNRDFNNPPKKDYFTKAEMLRYERNCLRYIMARWGYSPAMAFYGYSEAENWIREVAKEDNRALEKELPLFVSWATGMKSYMQDSLQYNHINFLCTYATVPDFEFKNPATGVFAMSDVVGFHKYQGEYKDVVYGFYYDKTKKLAEKFGKPVILEEMGYDLPHLYCCTDADVEKTVWASSFMGMAGCGMHWWWESLHSFGYQHVYTPLWEFFKSEDLRQYDYVPVRRLNSRNIKNAGLEAYSLVDEDGRKVLGYIHRADIYWRNLTANYACLRELVTNNTLKEPCVLDDGGKIGVLNPDERISYKEEKYEDAFTKLADAGERVHTDMAITITGLKRRGIFSSARNAHKYKVTLYAVEKDRLVVISEQSVTVSRKGVLTITIPGDQKPASFAFKAVYEEGN